MPAFIPSTLPRTRQSGRRPKLLGLACFASALFLGSADAEQVYKCTDPQGGIAFQDHACSNAERQSVLQLAPQPTTDTSEAQRKAADDATPETTPPPTADVTPPPRRALPALWMCTRYDDEHYVSTTGAPPPLAVPLGILGYPPSSLGQVYGSDRIGHLAPAGRPSSTAPAAGRNSAAADYTWTQDTCTPASIAQTCAYLRKQYDSNHRALRNAAKDDQSPLEARERELREQLGGC